jgi:hypothetical protein
MSHSPICSSDLLSAWFYRFLVLLILVAIVLLVLALLASTCTSTLISVL